MGDIPELIVVEDPKAAETMLHPIRRKLLRALVSAKSAAAAAKELGIPRQHANYHVRELESAGLLRVVAETRKGNVTERIVQSVAKSFSIGPKALGDIGSDPEKMESKFSAEFLVAVADRMVGELGRLARRKSAEASPLSTLSVEAVIGLGSPEERERFAQELTTEIARVVERHHRETPGAEPFRMLIAIHPHLAQ